MSKAPEDQLSGQATDQRHGRHSLDGVSESSGDGGRLHVATRVAGDDATNPDRDPESSVAPELRGDESDRPEPDPDRPESGPTNNRPGTVRVEARGQTTVARSGVLEAPRKIPKAESTDRLSAGELIEQLSPPKPQRSTRGWRAMIGLPPGQKELDEIRDGDAVKTAFPRPVTIMVANPKGGSGKTPTTLLLAAALGQMRGGGVVAWDNNELRGTLPDRSRSPHRRNVHSVLQMLDQLRWSTSSFTDLAYFLNHQSSGNFYTLGSAQHVGQVITAQNFRQVHELFCRYFQVIVVDTGNNEAAPNWTAAAGEADCLVVPTKWRKDSLIPAARMLESLQDTNPGLLDRTVIAATNGPMDCQKDVRDRGASWFGSSHPIVDLPTDPHVAEGGIIDWSQLAGPTRRAATRLAAEVTQRLIAAGSIL